MIDGVHIWRAALDDPAWPGPEELPPQERERTAAFLREDVARRWVAARWALRQVLARYLEVEPATVELEVDQNGKPRLRDNGPHFNLSHSEGMALVAVASRSVGIDVEAIRPLRDPTALAERALPPSDAAAVGATSAAEQATVFYRAWTRHEARLKCLGTGLGGSVPAAGVAVAEIEVGSEFAAAVAIAAPEVGAIARYSLCPG